jgi:hypothetical protein
MFLARRRSNVVKEVEKLKKNREERRIRQAEIKTEKENQMNLDPGNPNWEFLSMIRCSKIFVKPIVTLNLSLQHRSNIRKILTGNTNIALSLLLYEILTLWKITKSQSVSASGP